MLAQLAALALLAATPTPPASATAAETDRAAYEAARARAGRDPRAHIDLALWCEARGLSAEKMKHLALAVLNDPANATARGLMGLVGFKGRWERPEAVRARVESDDGLAAKLAEYNARRARMAGTADAHWNLALWCEENGLAAESRAHLAAVTRLDPSREAAWKRLGFRKHEGRWTTDAQLAAARADAEAQKKADLHWKPLLEKWRGWLAERDPARRDRAEEALAGVTDPRAVPSVWAVFGQGNEALQAKAVQVLGQIDAPGASRALAVLAAFGKSAEVRRAAIETLRRRDGRDYLGLLVNLVRDPIRYEVRPGNDPTRVGELFVEGKQFDVRRVYGLNATQLQDILRPVLNLSPTMPRVPPVAPNATRTAGVPASGFIAGVGPVVPEEIARLRRLAQVQADLQLATAVSQQQLNDDLMTLEALNAGANRINAGALPALNTLSGEDLGASSEDWRKWWADQQGYAYESADPPAVKPTLTEFVPNPVTSSVHQACFARGTPVQTLAGPRPIESIRVGDQVLAQDAETGRLGYQPVVAVFHNKPAATLKIDLGDETIVATGIHRFWKAGKGWTMARELKPGDTVRVLGGVARVAGVESDRVQPVFNLEVAEGSSFFVGARGALVHDNSPVRPVAQPFDAPPALAALSGPASTEAPSRP